MQLLAVKMRLWPIFKNKRDIDRVPDADVPARVQPLLKAIEQAVKDWKETLEEIHGDETAEEFEDLMGSCLCCIETLVAKLQRLSQISSTHLDAAS
jgi:hypothetical protein